MLLGRFSGHGWYLPICATGEAGRTVCMISVWQNGSFRWGNRVVGAVLELFAIVTMNVLRRISTERLFWRHFPIIQERADEQTD